MTQIIVCADRCLPFCVIASRSSSEKHKGSRNLIRVRSYNRFNVRFSLGNGNVYPRSKTRECSHKAQTRHTYGMYSATFLPRKFYEPIHLLISIRSALRDKTRVRQSGYSELPGIARSANQLRLFPCRGKEGGLKGDLSCFSNSQQPLFASEPPSCSISLFLHSLFFFQHHRAIVRSCSATTANL